MGFREQEFHRPRPALVTSNLIIAIIIAFLLILLSSTVLHDIPIIKDLFHETGFALLVAVTIWGTFEFFKHEESEEQWNARIEKIARNVFLGVFRRNFPPEFIKEANLLVLDHSFIRKGLHLTYTLQDDTYTDRAGHPQRYIRFTAIARFTIQNISDKRTSFPVQIGLPNPLIDELKQKCRVHKIIVKSNGNEEDKNLSDSEEKFRKDICDDNKHHVPFSIESVCLEPEAEAEVIIHYTMAKELDDTEIFQTLYPTDSVIITIVDRCPNQRIIRARSIHTSQLEDDTSAEATGTYNYSLKKYLLPHQGFAIWWKQAPPSPNHIIESP